MPHVKSLAAGLLSLATATLAVAQQPTGDAIDRSQLFRTQPGVRSNATSDEGETAMGYAASSPNDADLGIQAILKRQEQYKAFTVSLSAPFYWTSNVALTRTGEVSDGVFAPLASVFYQPHIWKTLYGEVGAVQQIFNYDRYSSFNFNSFDGIAGLVYYMPQFYNLSLRLRYDYNRLTDDQWNEFFSNHQLLLMAEVPIRFGRAMLLTVGGVVDLSLSAEPQEPRRNEFDFYAGYQLQFSRSLYVTLVGRVIVKDYFEGDRTDVSEILSLTADYHIREWLLLSAIGTFAWNQSNHSVFDYQVNNLGGALALTIRF